MKTKKKSLKKVSLQNQLENVKVKPLKQKAKKIKKKAINKIGEGGKRNLKDHETVEFVTKELPEKVVEVPKIRRSATSEHVEENFIIVPWASSEEWNNVCQQFHDRNYKEVIARIAVWQNRVPSLPVGVEATLFLLEALVYDDKFVNMSGTSGLYSEDQARSLYSLSIIRYLNHVSQLATQSLGGSSRKITRELAAIVDTPDWLVALRNDISHGPSAPSIEVVRMGGDFVLQWLKEKYWKLPESNAETSFVSNDPFTILPNRNEVNIPGHMSELLAAYIATRIYKMRKQNTLTDPDVIRHFSGSPTTAVKTKVALKALKKSLKQYFLSHPSQFAVVVSQELVPSSEFFEDFKLLIKCGENQDIVDAAFNKYFELWLPIVKLMESKGELISVIKNLTTVMVDQDCERMWDVCARWIDKLLELVENSGIKCSKHIIKILQVVIKHPNHSTQHFLDRMFRLTEPRLGCEAIQKLTYLASIWSGEVSETKKRKKQAAIKLFTLDDIAETTGSNSEEIFTDASLHTHQDNGCLIEAWSLDDRGEEFWQTIPLGGFL